MSADVQRDVQSMIHDLRKVVEDAPGPLTKTTIETSLGDPIARRYLASYETPGFGRGIDEKAYQTAYVLATATSERLAYHDLLKQVIENMAALHEIESNPAMMGAEKAVLAWAAGDDEPDWAALLDALEPTDD